MACNRYAALVHAVLASCACAQSCFQFHDVGQLGADDVWIKAVSADGSRIAGLTDFVCDGCNDSEIPFVGPVGGPYTFLPADPAPEVEQADVHDLSGDGLTAVGSVRWWQGGNLVEERAAVWNGGTLTDLGVLGGTNFRNSVALGVSDDGSVVVGSTTTPAGSTRAFKWTSAGGMQDLGVPAGKTQSEALAVSSDGIVIAALCNGEVYRWTPAGGWEYILGFGFIDETWVDLSADGTTLAFTSRSSGVYTAYRWSYSNGLESIGSLGGTRTIVSGISGDGAVIVGESSDASGTVHQFIWTEGVGMEIVPVPPGSSDTKVLDVSADGRTIAGYHELPGSSGHHGAVWTINSDLDGDGIPCDWETDGIPYLDDAGVEQRIPLPNANPLRKDLFVEVDSMAGIGFLSGVQVDLVIAFAKAPNPNPDGSTGINLHIQIDDKTIPHQAAWATAPDGWPNDFEDTKDDWFGTDLERNIGSATEIANRLAAKALVYRYCVLIDTAEEGYGGIAHLGGDDFVVCLGMLGTRERQAAVWMHELGHNLGLKHGGCDHIQGKPNYPSIMNYLFAVPSPWMTTGFWALDYSRSGDVATGGEFRPLDECALDEPNGIGTPGGYYAKHWAVIGYNEDLTPGAACDGAVIRKPRVVPLDGTPIDFGHDTLCSDPVIELQERMIVDFSNLDATEFTVSQDLNYADNIPPALEIALPTTASYGDVHKPWNDWENIRLATLAMVGSPRVAPEYPQEVSIAVHDWIDENFPRVPRLCQADLNGDGLLNVDDIDLFVAAFVAGDPAVDMDANGLLNVDDVDVFVAAFLAGCP